MHPHKCKCKYCKSLPVWSHPQYETKVQQLFNRQIIKQFKLRKRNRIFNHTLISLKRLGFDDHATQLLNMVNIVKCRECRELKQAYVGHRYHCKYCYDNIHYREQETIWSSWDVVRT